MSSVTGREKAFYEHQWQALARLQEVVEPLWVPEVDLGGARMLICSTGVGLEPVRAVRAGARQVVVFDLSSAAIDNARKMAAYNRVNVAGIVANFHDLPFLDDTFDVLFGESILHHVDCVLAGREIYRCLKPGGIAFFYENSGRNLLIRLFRLMLGRPGGTQKQRFLFVRRHGTVDEFPLTRQEVAILSKIFDGHLKVLHGWFVFFSLLSTHVWQNPRFEMVMRGLDAWLAKVLPFVRPYSFQQQLWMQKTAEPSRPTSRRLSPRPDLRAPASCE